MEKTNAQVALEAAVTLHVGLERITTASSVVSTADVLLDWLNLNTPKLPKYAEPVYKVQDFPATPQDSPQDRA